MNKDSFWTSVFTVPEFNSYLNSYQLLQTKLCFSPYRLLPPPTQPPFKVSDWSLLINQTNLFTSIHAEKYFLFKNIKQCCQRKTVISQTLDKSDIATFSRSIAKDLHMYKMSYYWYLLSAIATNAFIYRSSDCPVERLPVLPFHTGLFAQLSSTKVLQSYFRISQLLT